MIDIEVILVAGRNIRNTRIFPRSVENAGSVLGRCRSSLKRNPTSGPTWAGWTFFLSTGTHTCRNT